MTIYYLMVESVPKRGNIESKTLGGAYVNCWVKAKTKEEALSKAKEYIDEEGWIPIKTEDIFIAHRNSYIDMPESLECYDEACKYGMSAIFNTWPIGSEE